MAIGIDTNTTGGASIKVIGLGGGGGNAVNNMIRKGLSGVDFIVANTDTQALEHNLANTKIQLGADTTRGLGAGANPEMGKLALQESENEIREALKDSDMIFITCGMGGGTGTGSAPVVAKLAKESGSLVVAIVTKPFLFESRKRVKLADEWIETLREHVDALIVIPNQRLLEIIDKDTTFTDAFLKVDEVLYNATRGISDIISCHGYVNVDFADVQTIMKDMGDALMGIGTAGGEHRAIEATQKALNSPLLDGVSIGGAKGILVNITGGKNMTMHEISEAVSTVEEEAGGGDGDTNLIHGVVYNDEMGDEIMVTVVATGFNSNDSNIKETEESAINIAEVQTLPFESEGQSENKVDVNSESISEKIAQEAINQVKYRQMASSYSSSPKGPNQLDNFNAPAAFRRGQSGAMLGEQGGFRTKSLGNDLQKVKSENVQENQAEHKFIRKLMD
jgi:cell division protein FtsZ